jgi:hypothetical protein
MERAVLFILLLHHLDQDLGPDLDPALDQASPLQELYVALLPDEHGRSILQHYTMLMNLLFLPFFFLSFKSLV